MTFGKLGMRGRLMSHFIFPFFLVLLGVALLKAEDGFSHHDNLRLVPTDLMTKKKNVETAPLDVNDNVGHVLELVGKLVGILGNSVSGLTYELTGISLHDCAQDFKDKDFSEISCDEFLEILSMCESLGHIKPLLKTAKKRYQRMKGAARSSRLPCSQSS